jgi:hypothetical protein
MRGSRHQKLAVASALTVLTLALPAVAQASRRYMECDRPSSADYPNLRARPSNCALGINASFYDVQPVAGHVFGSIVLRNVRWSSWGGYRATGHGQACNMNASGYAIRSQCAHARVRVWHPVLVQPAGGVLIYQRTRVTGGGAETRFNYFNFWWQPGTDY